MSIGGAISIAVPITRSRVSGRVRPLQLDLSISPYGVLQCPFAGGENHNKAQMKRENGQTNQDETAW